MLALAASDTGEEDFAGWLRERIIPLRADSDQAAGRLLACAARKRLN